MKIKSIKWNGRIESRYYNGESIGNDYNFNEAIVRDNDYTNNNTVKEIREHTAGGEGDKWYYDIYYDNGKMLRVFNPIEVSFI